MIDIEVAYALPDEQIILSMQVSENCTVAQAILQSGIVTRFPTLNLQQQAVGIFSKVVTLETIVQAGDRIEIYRSLIIDPKVARRQRAKKRRLG